MMPRRWPPKFSRVRSLWRRSPGERRAESRSVWRRSRVERRAESPDPLERWHGAGAVRRTVLGLLVLAQTIFATDFMTAVLPYHGTQPLEIAILVLFAILFCWVSLGFWTAVLGFVVQFVGHGPLLQRHGLHTLLGVVWAAGVYWLNPSFLWWLAPVVGALMLSIPMSVYSSRISLGRGLRRAVLFVIPEEVSPPEELRRMQTHLLRAAPLPGFVEAVVDPLVHALACASGNMRRSQPAALRESRQRLIDEAVAGGPGALSNAQRAALLGDPLALSRLHFQVWSAARAHADRFGGEAGGSGGSHAPGRCTRAGGACGGGRIKAVNIAKTGWASH